MRFKNQTITENGSGNCMQAAIASLYDLDMDMVPNFKKFESTIGWFPIFFSFINTIGEYCSYGKITDLTDENSIDGCFYTIVKSRTFEGKTHAVLINKEGIVVHDPNPNKRFQGVNVLETKEFKYFYILKKKEIFA